MAKKDFEHALAIDSTNKDAKEGIAALETLAATSESAAHASILKSLPSDVQKEIEGVRQSCRELGPATSDYTPPRVTEGDEGLVTFKVSDGQAVLVDELNFCGDGFECIHGVNCATGYTHDINIYVRSGRVWRNALSTFASEPIFLSIEHSTEKFRLMVLHVFAGETGAAPTAGSHERRAPRL